MRIDYPRRGKTGVRHWLPVVEAGRVGPAARLRLGRRRCSSSSSGAPRCPSRTRSPPRRPRSSTGTTAPPSSAASATPTASACRSPTCRSTPSTPSSPRRTASSTSTAASRRRASAARSGTTSPAAACRAARPSPSSTPRTRSSPRSARSRARRRSCCSRSSSRRRCPRTRSSRTTSTPSTSAAARTASRSRAQQYFGKDVDELTLGESAALASIIRSPGNYDPADKDNVERLKGRIQYVLDGMVEKGWITQAQADDAKYPKFKKPKPANKFQGTNGYLLDAVVRELATRGITEDELNRGGLRVVTTFDKKAQGAAVEAVRAEGPKSGTDGLRIGLAAVRPGTGEVVAMYGGAELPHQPGQQRHAWRSARPARRSSRSPSPPPSSRASRSTRSGTATPASRSTTTWSTTTATTTTATSRCCRAPSSR